MTAESPALVRSFKVGRRTCTITIPKPVVGEALCGSCEWEPDTPKNGLSKNELRQYRTGRDAAYAELAATIGIKIAVVEI